MITALKIERCEGSTKIRAIVFEIHEVDSPNVGAASVAMILEADQEGPEIVHAFLEAYPDCNAVKVWEDTAGAEPYGNHWIIRPDCLSTWEAALAISDEIPYEMM